MPIISYDCSYGLENDCGSNEFSFKTSSSEDIIELGCFVQFGSNNPRSIGYQNYRTAKTDWCGKILNRDIDRQAKIITYTGVSLIGAINNFVPVRDTEKITVHNILTVSNGNVYASLADVPDVVLSTGFARMDNKFGISIRPVSARLHELCNYANYPISVDIGKDTLFGYNEKPTGFDGSRKTWDNRLSPYIDYQFGYNDRTFSHFRWRYCTNGSVYTYEETIPSGVDINFEVTGYEAVIELNHYSGVMDSIQDALIVDSELRVAITGNAPYILVNSRQPLNSDYIYVHDKSNLKIFSSLPYTAMATGVEGGPDPFSTAIYRLMNNSGLPDSPIYQYGYYDLVYGQRWGFGNDDSWDFSDSTRYSTAGNLHMLKEDTFDYERVWDASREEIEKLSNEIIVDGVDDPDYVLQHEYIFIYPQELPDKLLSDWSPAGAHAMKMILKNKRITADLFSSKIIYSFYPELSYERGA